jgi:hypothetical protein
MIAAFTFFTGLCVGVPLGLALLIVMLYVVGPFFSGNEIPERPIHE